MGSCSIDPLGDSMAPDPGDDSRARIESWVHYLQSLAEEVQDDPELAAGLARQIRRAEDELAALAQGEAARRRSLRELQKEREKRAARGVARRGISWDPLG